MKTSVIIVSAMLLSLASRASEPIPGPLLDGLGDLHHPVTTRSRDAQRYFDQGMRLVFGFNHQEAIRSFRSAAHFDPECAMSYWGVAYAYGPHVNKPMSSNDTASAWAALQSALVHKDKVSNRERAYITALQARYDQHHSDDRSALDKAFAEAMRDLVRRYPDDLDARVIFAESLMNTMPWDYWTRDRTPKPETEEVLDALRYVMARNPDHPGANHFYIHAVEAGPNPDLALTAADRLLNYAPNAGHLVHMPAHIYMRVGQYNDAVIANEKAEKADRAYIRQCRVQGFYPGAYYPHNIHFLWWAQFMDARSADAARTARRAAEYALDNYCGPTKALEGPRLRHLPWLTAVRFGHWDGVLAVPKPPTTNDFLVDRAIWHFARGVAFAGKGQVAAAEREQEAFDRILGCEEVASLDSPAFPVKATLQLAGHCLAGRIAGAKGNNNEMIAHLEKAVEDADQMPYMEPSYWPFPTRPTLGAAYLKAGQPVKAEKIFRQDLAQWPRNGWSLFGLEQALRAQGRNESADLVRREFNNAWKRADVKLSVDWL